MQPARLARDDLLVRQLRGMGVLFTPKVLLNEPPFPKLRWDTCVDDTQLHRRLAGTFVFLDMLVASQKAASVILYEVVPEPPEVLEDNIWAPCNNPETWIARLMSIWLARCYLSASDFMAYASIVLLRVWISSTSVVRPTSCRVFP